jgi:hypothetical protein
MDPQWATFGLAASNLVLSAVIGWFAVSIARQQARTARQQAHTARQKLRLDLYDRRYAVYDALQRLIEQAQSNQGDALPIIGQYLAKREAVKFLLHDDAINNFVSELWDKLGDLHLARTGKDSPVTEIRTRNIAKVDEIEKWLEEQPAVVVRLFQPHLHISD